MGKLVAFLRRGRFVDKVRLQRVFHVRYVSYVPRYAEFRVMGLVFVPSLILLLSSKFRSDVVPE